MSDELRLFNINREPQLGDFFVWALQMQIPMHAYLSSDDDNIYLEWNNE